MMSIERDFLPELHARFIQRFLKYCPNGCRSFDTIRPTLAFFVISGLDVLNALDSINEEEKQHICDWVYNLQVALANGDDENIHEINHYGFHGSTLLWVENNENSRNLKVGHIAMTYSSLCILTILGDDLSRINKSAILTSIKHLQMDNGGFLSSTIGGETDMRFTYCVAVICYILNDWSYIDVDKAVSFIVSSISYDGGISQEPNAESHGGSSFCGVAALSVMGKLNESLSTYQIQRLRRWLIMRQETAFQGRPNKLVDTCYSFWVGAALKDRSESKYRYALLPPHCFDPSIVHMLLGTFQSVNWEENRKYILSTQDSRIGGFSKWPDTNVDLLHTYFGLCGLSLMRENGVEEIHPALNMTQRAFHHLLKIHKKWECQK